MSKVLITLVLVVGGFLELIYRLLFTALCVIVVYPVTQRKIDIREMVQPYLWTLLDAYLRDW